MTVDSLEAGRNAARNYLESVRADLEADVPHELRVARLRLAVMRTIPSNSRPELPKGASVEEMKTLLDRYPDRLEYDDDLAEPVIRRAARDRAAHEALLEIADEMIDAGPLPSRLGAFVKSAMRKPAPAHKPGPRPTTTRNVHLAVAIKLASDAAGIRPTKGESKPANERICGADLVAEVWADLGYKPIGLATLRDIWHDHSILRSDN